EVDHRVAVAPEPEIFHELAKDLAIERNVFVIVGVLGACAACAPRQRQGQRDGRGRGDAPQPLRMSVPHSYPLQMTAKCAVSPHALVAKTGAFWRPRGRWGPQTTAGPPRQGWPRRQGKKRTN